MRLVRSGLSTLVGLLMVLSVATGAAPSENQGIDYVLVHPPFSESYSCAEHWDGQFAYLGDSLGSDCTIGKLVDEEGRLWMREYRNAGLENEDWYGYGSDVLAPCDCTVVKIRLNPVENSPGKLGSPPASSITFQMTDETKILIAHVKDVQVVEGDAVSAGDVVASVGNNGYSRQPHAHLGAWRGDEALQIRFDQRRMQPKARNGKLPDHVVRLFTSIAESPPDNLLSKEGQTFMQMLPAVGREDLHAAQDGWPMNPRGCEAHQVQEPVVQQIVDAARETSIVIINEAHDRPRHRDFIREVAVALKPIGYSHFAAETFAESISELHDVNYPLVSHGHYSNEPVYGALLRELTKMGFEFVPYEYRGDRASADLDTHTRASIREEGQAQNLKAVFDTLPKGERMIVHVGFSHAAEVPIQSFGGKDLAWMASRLKEKTGVDPLTIDQTDCAIDNDLTSRAQPSFKHKPGQFDLVVGHPDLTFSSRRPGWRQTEGVRQVSVPARFRSDRERVIVEVRPEGEPNDTVPVDRLMLWTGDDIPLLLPVGVYDIVSYSETSKRVVSGSITVKD